MNLTEKITTVLAKCKGTQLVRITERDQVLANLFMRCLGSNFDSIEATAIQIALTENAQLHEWFSTQDAAKIAKAIRLAYITQADD